MSFDDLLMGIEDQSNDRLDAIATHAGCLISALSGVHESRVMPAFKAELARIETAACEELERRGVIGPLFFSLDIGE